MGNIMLRDGGVEFDATLLAATEPSSVILFAVGSGGNPERHLPLLDSLVKRGSTVIAPHFERLGSARPTAEELSLRSRRLRLAVDFASQSNRPVIGVGHSIGATLLLALAGGQMWLGPDQRLPLALEDRLSRLVLMAPATGFFQAPKALDQVHTPMLVWVGQNDVITSPAQADFLQRILGNRVPFDLRVVAGAGHFSFMNTLPPQTHDPMPDREGFLAELANEIGQWIST
jgi:pimeloyl-ACP methyl ester carboxylesterase